MTERVTSSFDVAGAGNGFTVELVRHRQTKGKRGHPLAGRSRSTDVSIGILLVSFFQLRDP